MYTYVFLNLLPHTHTKGLSSERVNTRSLQHFLAQRFAKLALSPPSALHWWEEVVSHLKGGGSNRPGEGEEESPRMKQGRLAIPIAWSIKRC